MTVERFDHPGRQGGIMNGSSAKITAELMAWHRTLEFLRHPGERVCNDPYALYFLNPQQTRLLKNPIRLKIRGWFMEWLFPGVNGAIVARVRFMDDHLATCLEKGVTQFVILGAGYDTRAYRFEALKQQAMVFEVDHPATLRIKREKLRLIFNGGQEHVVHVPMDLKTDQLGEKLFENGYDPRKKTLFILEGLVMYLTREDVDLILAFITTHSGPDSSVVFDCLPHTIVDGTIRAREGRAMYRYVRRNGEPFAFGLTEDDVTPYLRNKHFKKIKLVNAGKFKSDYFKGACINRKVSEIFSFVKAWTP